mmetsp:Transcript_20754/g.62517  ORF Transcript_20754/g.62517 Transcript_20754/m.62517 type:complete len:386 (+) Transcript_20754:176-1333(+)
MQQEHPSSGMIELLSASQGAAEAAPAGNVANLDGDDDGDGAGRGRKRSTASRPENERVAAVQEKNRKAQKRFRERQKEKMTTMEAELGELRTQLSKLREDNSLLAGRNAVLEKVLALREEQLKAVQSGYQLSAAPALPGSSAGLSMGLLNMSGVNTNTSSGAAVSAPAAALMSMAAGGSLAGLLAGPGANDTKPALAAQPSAGTGANPAWAPMVDELVQLRSRMASDSNRDPSIEARFVQVATEAGNLSAKLSPTARVGYGRSDGQPNNSAPDPAKWTHLARILEVSDAKRNEIRQALAVLRERLAAINAARPALMAAAAAASQSDSHAENQQVLDSRMNEQMLCQDFAAHLFTKVLTPLQFGVAAVHAHPYYVDAIALAEALTS